MKRELYTKIPPKSMVRAYREKGPSQLPKGRRKEGTPFFTFNFSLLPIKEGVGLLFHQHLHCLLANLYDSNRVGSAARLPYRKKLRAKTLQAEKYSYSKAAAAPGRVTAAFDCWNVFLASQRGARVGLFRAPDVPTVVFFCKSVTAVNRRVGVDGQALCQHPCCLSLFYLQSRNQISLLHIT